MKIYNVRFPVVLEVMTQVEVEDDQDENHAIDKAFDGFPGVEVLTTEGNHSDYFFGEGCGPLRHVTQGNVCYAPINDAEAELEE